MTTITKLVNAISDFSNAARGNFLASSSMSTNEPLLLSGSSTASQGSSSGSPDVSPDEGGIGAIIAEVAAFAAIAAILIKVVYGCHPPSRDRINRLGNFIRGLFVLPAPTPDTEAVESVSQARHHADVIVHVAPVNPKPHPPQRARSLSTLHTLVAPPNPVTRSWSLPDLRKAIDPQALSERKNTGMIYKNNGL